MMFNEHLFTGEIDIVEGVGDNTNDQATLHTLEGCSLASSSSSALDITGSVITSTDCVSTGGGCGIRSSSTVSYGAAFNGNGGGVFTSMFLTFFSFRFNTVLTR